MTTTPADEVERARVLLEIDHTLVVEAAAGTGKTALMAGRVTMLLLRGTPPAEIAAITFTELAASETAARVHAYVEDLLAGRIPAPMRQVLSAPLTSDQLDTLRHASADMGMLTATTIHSYCQSLITSYAVEANVDPGVGIIDRDQQDAAFEAVFDHWLKRRLNQAEGRDVISVLSRDDPTNVVKTLREMAAFRLKHRGSGPAPSELSQHLERELSRSVDDFSGWVDSNPRNQTAEDLVVGLKQLAGHFVAKVVDGVDFATLWTLAHPPDLGAFMRKESKDLHFPNLRTGWIQDVGKQRAQELENDAKGYFEAIAANYARLLGGISGRVLERLCGELDEVLADYALYKRSAAVLDFDDLLEMARLLVERNVEVRAAIGHRFRHILVDEFQDTDPIQCAILFRITSQSDAERWEDCPPRPGSLFVVGDPKQAIYRFRGADIACYEHARAALERSAPGCVVRITANFRSRPAILRHVNKCFAQPLSARGQPGYVGMTATVEEGDANVCGVMTFEVEASPSASVREIREAEAARVAEICHSLIAGTLVQGVNGARPVRPADIALLAPTGTQLEIYEQALEARGLTVASQAGKGFYRRQETQDLLALARVLANPRDGIAFGALLRGPLVGLTDEELLDIADRLPQDEAVGPPARFTVLTATDDISNPLAREVVSALQDLRARARSTTPALLLSAAAERLHVRAILLARDGPRSARTLANLEAFIDVAKSYEVLGLRRFVRDITTQWRKQATRKEGRVAAEGNAIEITTIHSAKGLEWPIVIPINTVTGPPPRRPFVHRMSDNTIHWLVGDVVPPELAEALGADETSHERERERLWYVACTRARELLLLPKIAGARPKSWARVIPWTFEDVGELQIDQQSGVEAVRSHVTRIAQDKDAFAADQLRIVNLANSMKWIRPSDADSDRVAEMVVVEGPSLQGSDESTPLGGGRVRGLILHKLLEEILSKELVNENEAVAARATILTNQLSSAMKEGAKLPDPTEMAQTVARTLRIPEVSAFMDQLIPEFPVYGMLEGADMTALSGRVDAFTLSDDGRVDIVVDWKSDVNPTESVVQQHSAQLLDYMTVLDAGRGALVYMTPGSVRWLTRRP